MINLNLNTVFLGYLPGAMKGAWKGSEPPDNFPDAMGDPKASSKQARQATHARFLYILEQLLRLAILLDQAVHILDLSP